MTKKKKPKKETKQVRISLQAYEQIRRQAFRAHKSMVFILEQLIESAPNI